MDDATPHNITTFFQPLNSTTGLGEIFSVKSQRKTENVVLQLETRLNQQVYENKRA